MPITAFIGVRISWLMVARKALLARAAARASSRERSSSRLVSRSDCSAWRCALRKDSTNASATAPNSSCAHTPNAASAPGGRIECSSTPEYASRAKPRVCRPPTTV